jgi:antitoxin VapB
MRPLIALTTHLIHSMISIMRSRRAKVFMTGRSQAVRLPKEFRFEGETVLVRREGQAVILEPDTWPEGWVESFAGIPSDFADFVRPPQGEAEEREKLG